MQIFLSYASQDRAVARAIELGLREQGHDVFFDRDDLPAGEEFHNRIRKAIEQSDLVVFLVSPDSVDAGSYTLTELEIAEKSWKQASGKLLPVILRPTPRETIPAIVRSVTFLHSDGNVAASVVAAVHRLDRARKRKVYGRIGVAAIVLVLIALVAVRQINREPASEITGNDGAPAVLVPAGTYTRGDDENVPKRELFLDAFYIDRFEVTTSRFARFLEATGSARTPDGWGDLDRVKGAELPVVGVDWNNADAYCRWAGRRLPTEAEWEKAARGTDARKFPWGDVAPTPEHANYENSSPLAYDGGLTPVGKFAKGNSPYGVSDMAGNVSEWVADWHAEGLSTTELHNPRGPSNGENRVVRGGARFDPGFRLGSVLRWHAQPAQRSDDIGFRCARNVE